MRVATRLSLTLLFLSLAAAACGPSRPDEPEDAGRDSADAPTPHQLISLTVTPTNPIVELDLGATGAQTFVVTGNFTDGVPEDLSSQVTWTVANPAVGALTNATLAIPAFATATAEVSRLTARMGDLMGEAQITVVAYRRTGPTQDFFFVLPFEDPAGPAVRPLDFSTAIPALDVAFLMDTTGSMSGSISNLQQALSTVIIPGIRAVVPDAQFAVAGFEDFPLSPWGSGGDQPFSLLQTITASVAAVQAGVAQLSLGGGNDWPEAGMEALYQAATGNGLTGPTPTSVPANHTGLGGVAFRAGTMPVIVQITDAMMHGPGETGVCTSTGSSAGYTGPVLATTKSRVDTKAALAAICARVVGVAPIQTTLAANCSGQADLEDFATATGALVPPEAWDVGPRPANCAAGYCCTDINGAGRLPDAQGRCPVVFRANTDGTGLGTNIVTGIRMLARFATFDVNSERLGGTTDIDGVPLPGGHTTADFLTTITPTSYVLPPPPPFVPLPFFDATTFHEVTPGTTVSFDVAAFNSFVPQRNDAQIFRATIRVLAGQCTPLDQRDVLILVPPTPIVVE